MIVKLILFASFLVFAGAIKIQALRPAPTTSDIMKFYTEHGVTWNKVAFGEHNGVRGVFATEKVRVHKNFFFIIKISTLNVIYQKKNRKVTWSLLFLFHFISASTLHLNIQ